MILQGSSKLAGLFVAPLQLAVAQSGASGKAKQKMKTPEGGPGSDYCEPVRVRGLGGTGP